MRKRFASMPGVELTDLPRDHGDSAEVVTAVVRTPTAITPAQVDSLTAPLEAALGTPVILVVRSVITRGANRARFLSEPGDTLPPATQPPPTRAKPPARRRR